MSRAWVGYHASHEMFHPSDLLRWTQAAERAGFSGAMCSDHLHPWSRDQGQSAHSWSWLGAALATTGTSIGVVTAPGQRMHPAIVAQASATLEAMHPGRFWMALGSGESLNEHVTGGRWPPKEARNERLAECVRVIRALHAGEEVTFEGRHVTVDRARVWTLPARPPLIAGAALTAETARWVGTWADALITTGDPDGIRDAIAAFRKEAPDKPAFVQWQLAWDRDGDAAMDAAHRSWRFAALGGSLVTDLATPEEFDAATAFVRPEDVAKRVPCGSDLAEHAGRIQRVLDAGADRVYLHNVGPDQDGFIAAFGREVLPNLRPA